MEANEKMNKKEKLIISALRQDSRKSLTTMSRELRIPVSTLHEKLQSFKGDLIKRNTALIDFTTLGFNTRANVFIKVEREQRQEVKNFLLKTNCVNTLLKVNNGYDFMIEFIFRHIKDMEDFIEELEQKFKILAKDTFYIVDDIKREEFLANPRLVSMGVV